MVTSTTIPASTTRSATLVSVVGAARARFCGLYFTWTDNFQQISSHTHVYIWQPTLWEPVPETVLQWAAEGTSHGCKSYHHVERLTAVYISTAPVTLTLTAFDGTAPAPIVLPSTSGAKQKAVVRLSFNKALLYTYTAQSTAQFQLWLEETVARVKPWGSAGPYEDFKAFRTAGV